MKPCRVIVEGDGDGLQAHPVAEPAENRAHANRERIVALAPHTHLFVPVLGVAQGSLGVETRLDLVLPVGTGLHRELEPLGHMVGELSLELPGNDALRALDDPVPFSLFEDGLFEGGDETEIDGHVLAQAVKAEELVEIDVVGPPFTVPPFQRLRPEAHFPPRATVAVAIVHRCQETFAAVHRGRLSPSVAGVRGLIG